MICRLCFNNLNEECAVVLFGTDENVTQENHLVKMIKNYLYIELCQDDTISTTICVDCCENLLHFHKFWQLIEQKQSALRDEVQKIECEIECEVSDCESEIEFEHTKDNYNGNPINDSKPQDLSLKYETNDDTNLKKQTTLAAEHAKTGNETPTDMPLDFSNTNKRRNERTNGLCGAAKRKHRMVHATAYNMRTAAGCASGGDSGSGDSGAGTSSTITTNDEHQDSGTETITEPPVRAKRPSNQLIYKENEEIIASFMVLHCAECELLNQSTTQQRKEYKSFAELRVHFQEAHSETSPYVKCCDVVFTRPARLVEHVRWHQDPEIYKCDTCGKVLRSKISLQNHFRVTHKLKSNSDTTTEEQTEETEVNNDAKAAPQPQTTTPNQTVQFCETCGQHFESIPNLERHMLEHQTIFETRVQCQNCDEWLNNESCLNQHQCKNGTPTEHIDPETVIVCNTCGKVCATHSALLGHMQYAHKMLKRFSCEYCKKTFKQKRYLDEHVATHTGEKAYTCPYCPTPFRCKSNMYTHVKRKHMTEWLRAKKAKANA